MNKDSQTPEPSTLASANGSVAVVELCSDEKKMAYIKANERLDAAISKHKTASAES